MGLEEGGLAVWARIVKDSQLLWGLQNVLVKDRHCIWLAWFQTLARFSFLFFFSNNSLFYLFIFGCVGSSFLCEGFL